MTKICPKGKKFNPNERLPNDWIIPSSGHHFYRYGFSQYRNGFTDRPKLYYPLLVFILSLVYNLRCLYSALTPPKTKDFHLLIGDWGYFVGLQFQVNIMQFLWIGVGLVSQIAHYYEYVCDRGQPYMNVFNMMSGQITPHSIGLNDEKIIKVILKRTRICFKLNDFARNSTIQSAAMLSMLCFLIFVDVSFKNVSLALINTMILTLVVHYMFNGIFSQILYFHIICYYLKLKQREVNNYLRKVIENKKKIKIFRVFSPDWSFHYFNFIISNQKFFTQHNMFWFNSFTIIFLGKTRD